MTENKTMAALPEYKRPPIVETALGIEFKPIAGWNLVHFGALWEKFRDTYPKTEVHPAISPNAEMDLTNPPIRFLFTNLDGTQAVQLRSGAFVRNWRAMPENQGYPRYASIRPSFEHDLGVFYSFLGENGFPPPEVWKCEVTYVNHFLRGREWTEVADLHKVLPVFSSAHLTKLLSNPTQLRFVLNFGLADDLGDLQIQLVPGLRVDGKELLQLTLTSYGKPKSSDLHDILGWLDRGRHAVVQGFSDFTSEEAQTKVWERIWP